MKLTPFIIVSGALSISVLAGCDTETPEERLTRIVCSYAATKDVEVWMPGIDAVGTDGSYFSTPDYRVTVRSGATPEFKESVRERCAGWKP